MATVKKGILSRAGEWWRHLRRTKGSFWKRERLAERKDIKARYAEMHATDILFDVSDEV